MSVEEQQKTNKNHAVPQNIMDVEFKLIGDLTMRQFTYLLVFGLIAYIVFLTVVGVFKWPITLFFCLIGLALAFIPIQERGLDEWVVNFMRSVYTPTQRIWKKEPMLPIAFTYQNIALVKQELITLAPTSSRRKLEEYLEIQQKQYIEDRLDIPEKEYILKVRQAFTPVATSVDIIEEPETGYTEQYETAQEPQYEPQIVQPQYEAPKFSPVQPQQSAPVGQTEQPKPQPEISAQPSQSVSQTPQTAPMQPQVFKPFVANQTATSTTISAKQETSSVAATSAKPSISAQGAPQQIPTPQSFRPQDQLKKVIPGMMKKTQKQQVPIRSPIPDDFMASLMTPDRHAGRKFTSLLPSEGQLILPVRGEKVLETSEEINIQKDIQDKTDQLKHLLDQLRASNEVKPGTAPSPTPVSLEKVEAPKKEEPKKVEFKKEEPKLVPPVKEESKQAAEINEAESVVKKVKKENEILSNEIQKLKTELDKSQLSADEKQKKLDLINKLEREQSQTNTDYSALQRQVLELQRRLKDKEDPTARIKEEPKRASYAQIQPITNEPNVISGIIKNPNGEALPGIVLLIKNSKKEAVRALKTNALGQFSISTALMNGLYSVEVGSSVQDLIFDIITVEVKGEVLPPIEIIGRMA